MADFNIEVIGARELAVQYADAPALVSSTVYPLMRKIGARLQDYVVRRKLTGDPLKHRTRNLARAIFHRVELMGHTILTRVGVDLSKARYGRAHELGTVITAKNAKNLTIPVGEALTKSGVPRFTAREFIRATRSGGPGLYGFTSSFVNQNKTAILGVRKSGDYKAVFLLRQRTELPERPFLSSSLDENRGDIERALETGIWQALERGR